MLLSNWVFNQNGHGEKSEIRLSSEFLVNVSHSVTHTALERKEITAIAL